MKKLLLISSIAFSTFAFSQSGVKEDVDVLQSLYGKSKQELVRACMNLQEPQASAFERIYSDYESERKALGQKRMELIGDYAVNYQSLSDKKADELVKTSLANTISYEKMYLKYYGKAKKAIGAVNAAKFIQLESALQTAIKESVQNTIPFIGEIDRTPQN
jgi:ATP-dependent protease HslVU (ClpYQ) ATPase subunit